MMDGFARVEKVVRKWWNLNVFIGRSYCSQ